MKPALEPKRLPNGKIDPHVDIFAAFRELQEDFIAQGDRLGSLERELAQLLSGSDKDV